ncbi:hypothetical protein LGR54_20695 [Ancylobacter sp. Lp-2]|uniref:hypothetical protein n=1 Tax=Ancylobacter sp. Lp-2 TaxID=2881339 RepID=UPI001E5573AE|nr:hypothetical protein [Ancylobacter sp. Lp-2]MCB4771032.1 hypothetical protein [Ancylobacter sp. Lp-2]
MDDGRTSRAIGRHLQGGPCSAHVTDRQEIFADAVAGDLAQHPDLRFYQPAYRCEVRGADAVIAGLSRVAEWRLGRLSGEALDLNDLNF